MPPFYQRPAKAVPRSYANNSAVGARLLRGSVNRVLAKKVRARATFLIKAHKAIRQNRRKDRVSIRGDLR